MSNNISLRSILDANKLIVLNFLNWYCNVRIVFKQDKMFYVLKNPIPFSHDEDVNEEVRKA